MATRRKARVDLEPGGLRIVVRAVSGKRASPFAEVGSEEARDVLRRMCDQLGRPAQ